MHREQFRVLPRTLVSASYVAPHVTIGRKSVRRVTRHRIPALILVDEVIVRVHH